LFVHDAGVWKEITTVAPKIRQAGSWVPLKEAWVNQAGTWKKAWPNVVAITPGNIRFGTQAYVSGGYNVQVIWDPVSGPPDKYQLEVTRVGGSNPANAAVVDNLTTNSWNDVYLGPQPGIVVSYRVRSVKGASISAWSNMISVTTPADAGFAKCVGIGAQQTVWGAFFQSWQHDGNAQNKSLDLWRQLDGVYNFKFIKNQSINANPQSINDTVDASHYTGAVGSTGNQWSANTHWGVYCVNSWGKPQMGAGNPYAPDWGTNPNTGTWKFSPPGDKYIRLNAVGTNTWRRQPTNSTGWVGGVPRCGGNQGDMESLYMWDKGFLTDLGFRNRVRVGGSIQLGLGRAADASQVNVTFTVGYAGMSWGSSQNPDPITVDWGSRTWQRGNGELFLFGAAMSTQWTNPADPTASFTVRSGNTAAQYAEFGGIGQIVGGFVNGQIVMLGQWG
jgi:hypothetical protein